MYANSPRFRINPLSPQSTSGSRSKHILIAEHSGSEKKKEYHLPEFKRTSLFKKQNFKYRTREREEKYTEHLLNRTSPNIGQLKKSNTMKASSKTNNFLSRLKFEKLNTDSGCFLLKSPKKKHINYLKEMVSQQPCRRERLREKIQAD